MKKKGGERKASISLPSRLVRVLRLCLSRIRQQLRDPLLPFLPLQPLVDVIERLAAFHRIFEVREGEGDAVVGDATLRAGREGESVRENGGKKERRGNGKGQGRRGKGRKEEKRTCEKA